MKKQNLAKGLQLLFTAAMITLLILGIAPAQTARAEDIPSASDLVVTLVSIPKHVKACDIFEAVYTVTNLGPDTAYDLYYYAGIPDAFDVLGVMRARDFLAAGETATFSMVIKVVAFMPGERRDAWVNTVVTSEPYPDTSIDPNPENNSAYSPVKIISKPVSTFCF